MNNPNPTPAEGTVDDLANTAPQQPAGDELTEADYLVAKLKGVTIEIECPIIDGLVSNGDRHLLPGYKSFNFTGNRAGVVVEPTFEEWKARLAKENNGTE